MAQLTLKVIGNVDDVQEKIKVLKSNVEQNPIKIDIKTTGDTKALQALAKLKDAEAKAIKSENDLKIAREKTKQAADKRVTSENNLATQMEKTATAEENARIANTRLQQQIEKTNTTEAQAALQKEKTATAAENRARAEANATKQTKALGTATEETAKRTESLLDNFQKFARWYVIGNVFSTIAGSLRDALATMKEVDDELVTIRKVTGFSNEQVEGIRKQAYSTASQYGVGAADYLESVAAFSRAGYREHAAALAELSTKTQIVGDTTAETANQFLLAVDAAYKYKGNIKELTKVLDGANEIDNKYATSIEKIAEGMGIVAPVAAQMHVSVNELAAAIGTITAVTQRTGSEAARALRAIMLNIVGDTKTEIDEGVTWTTGEIAGLRDVIKQYAPEAYKAAEATGSIIDPMEAIGGLAKSMSEGLLTEQKLMEMVSDIGGKLRTSQLLAIIQNWDMYQSMLKDYAGAIGSADKEVNNALDSWTRKTNILKNTWAEFLQNFINSKTVKTALDALTTTIKFLDSGFGKAVVTAGLLIAAFGVLNKLTKGALIDNVRLLTQHFMGLQTEELLAAEATGKLGTAMMGLKVAIVGLAIVAAIELFKQLTAETENLFNQTLENANNARQKYQEIQSDLSNVNSKIAENNELIAEGNRLAKNDVYLQRLKNENVELETQRKTLELQLAVQKRIANQNAIRLWNDTSEYYADGEPATIGANIRDLFDIALKQAKRGNERGLTADLKVIEERIQIVYEILDALDTTTYVGKKTAEEIQKLINEYEVFLGTLEGSPDNVRDAALAIALLDETTVKATETTTQATKSLEEMKEMVDEATAKFKEYNEAVDSVQSALKILSEAQAEYEANGNLSIDTVQQLLSLDAEYLDALIDENGQININSKSISTLISGKKVLIEKLAGEAIASYAAKRAQELLADQLGETVKASDTAATRLSSAATAMASVAGSAAAAAGMVGLMNLALAGYGIDVGLDEVHRKILNSDVMAYAADIKHVLNNIDLSAGGWSPSGTEKEKTGSSSESKSEKDETLEYLKSLVELRKQEQSYLSESGASLEDQIAKMRDIQDALHWEADYLRSIGASEKDILALSTEWWQYENKILETTDKIAQKLRDEVEETLKGITDTLQEVADATIDPLKEKLDALKTAHDIEKDNLELAEKELAVEKARIALQNAQNERTVRQYNKATGQWEWVADAKAVEQAADNLEKAQSALDQFLAEQAYKDSVAELEAQIDETNNVFEAAKNTIEEFSNAIQEILKSPILDSGIKEKFVEDIKKILTAPTLDEETKVRFINNLVNIFKNDALTAEVKTKISSALSNLLGLENGKNAAELFYDFIETALNGTNNPQKAIEELSDAISGGVVSNITSIAEILKMLNGEYQGISKATAETLALAKMQANSIAWHMTTDTAEQERLHEENLQLGDSLDLKYDDTTGIWSKNGKAVYSLSNVGGNWVSEINSAVTQLMKGLWGGTYGNSDNGYTSTDRFGNVYTVGSKKGLDFIRYAAIGAKLTPVAPGEEPGENNTGDGSYWIKDTDGTTIVTTAEDKVFKFTPYDSGGILRGMGGIKATRDDEMVLPPKMTKALLDAERNGTFDALLGHLGIVTAAAQSLAGFGGGLSRSSIGSQHNGDIYQFGSISLSERQARSMTVYDLAQMSRTLSLQNA